MSHFVDLPKNVFCVEVHDYLSNKNFRYNKFFNSYTEAEEFIKHFNFKDDFLENPIGIYIIEEPSLNFTIGDINANK